MARTSWQDVHLALAPAWLRNPAGASWLRGLGIAKDELEQRMYDGAMARFIDRMAPSLLPAKGAERLLPRGPSDTDEGYRARVRGAWEVWPKAGTAEGVLQALWDAGYENYPVILTAKGFVYSLDGDRQLITERNAQESYDLDGTGRWNVYAVVFPTSAPQWSGGVPAQGSDEAKAVLALLARWAPALAALARVIIVESGNIWGYPLDLDWGNSDLEWGGTTTIWTP